MTKAIGLLCLSLGLPGPMDALKQRDVQPNSFQPLMCDIPVADQGEFLYLFRPYEDYLHRWAAIYSELNTWFSKPHREARNMFSVVDIGSNKGFFSVQTAGTFPNAFVIGVEGSVGAGNELSGGVAHNCPGLSSSAGVQNNLKWIETLDMPNDIIVGETWDFNRVQELVKINFTADVMYLLSMFHWMDEFCRNSGQYPHSGSTSTFDKTTDTVNLMAQLLSLANLHVIELPSFTINTGGVYLQHLRESFNGSEQKFLEAAMERSGRTKTMKKIHATKCEDPVLQGSEWCKMAGVRQIFVIEDKDELRTHDSVEMLSQMKSKCVLPTPNKMAAKGNPSCSTPIHS